MKKIKTAILGATGFVGQQFINILNEHPYFSANTLIASKRNEGKKYQDAVKWQLGNKIPSIIKNKKTENFSIDVLKKRNIKIVFSALPAKAANDYEKILREQGFFVFSNSSSYRMEDDVPILIPEVNPDHITLVDLQIKKYGGFIITNSNCSTTGIATILKALENFGLESTYISTYQSLSGGGINSMISLKDTNNVIPFINKEEEKIVVETQKILGKFVNGSISKNPLNILVNAARVTSLYSHLISLMVNLKKDVSIEDIKEKLSSFSKLPKGLNLPTAPKKYIEICKEKDRPQPELDYPVPYNIESGMIIKAGKIEKIKNTVKLFILFNNTIRGAAGASVLNAEFAIAKKLIKGVENENN